MDSPCESESSLDGGVMLPPSPVSREQLQKRIESLTQQNRLDFLFFVLACTSEIDVKRTLSIFNYIIFLPLEYLKLN